MFPSNEATGAVGTSLFLGQRIRQDAAVGVAGSRPPGAPSSDIFTNGVTGDPAFPGMRQVFEASSGGR